MLWLCFCVTVCFLVLSTPGPTEAGYEKTCSPERMNEGPVAHTLCGSRLSEAITSICDLQGISVTHSRRKRNEPRPSLGLQAILASREEALDYLGKRGNGPERIGVVCECCYHKCSIGELMEYCDVPVSRNSRSAVVPQSDSQASDPGTGSNW